MDKFSKIFIKDKTECFFFGSKKIQNT